MATSADRAFLAVARVNGSEDEELYQCIDSIVVNEDLERGSSFEIRLALCRNEDGSWPHLDDENLRPWNRVTLIAAFPDHADVIMDGYISHVQPSADPSTGTLSVKIIGVDASYAMNLEEKRVVWTEDFLGKELTYENIARKIIDDYKPLRPVPRDLGETGGGGGEALSVTQRGSDHRFLRELARRKGYEFYVLGGDVHFHPPDLSGQPQKLIAFNFGEETNCEDLQVSLDGTRPTVVQMSHIDPVKGTPDSVEVTSSELDALGTTDLFELRGSAQLRQTRIVVRRQLAMSKESMTDYARGLLRRHGWWIKASGTLNGLRYGRVLRSRKLVTIKGLGTSYNGNYYVRKVTHELGPRTYSMKFEAYRNRLGQLGTEDFSGERPDAAPIPVAMGAGADGDVVRVREDGPQVAPA